MIPLPTPRLDTLSALGCSPYNDTLLVATHDPQLLLYSAGDRLQIAAIAPSSTVLSICHVAANSTLVGCLDGKLGVADYENLRLAELSVRMPSGIAALCLLPDHNVVVGSDYAGLLAYIDPRTLCAEKTLAAPSRALAMDGAGSKIAVGRACHQVDVYDVRQPDSALETRPSGLRFPISAVACLPHGAGYALGSVDGRVSLEYFDAANDHLKFAFKAHRVPENDHHNVHSITGLVFHRDNILYTSGTDGTVCAWDYGRRKRVKQYTAGTNAVLHIDLVCGGASLAVGVSDYLHLRTLDLVTDPQPSGVFLQPL